MSVTDAAEGPSTGERRVDEADRPRAYASRPDADPLKAFRYWGGDPAAPHSGTPRPEQPRAAIAPEVPARPDPSEILRQLAALAVEDATREPGPVRVIPDRASLPKRGAAAPEASMGDAPAPMTRRSMRAAARAAAPADEEKSEAALHSERVEALASLAPILGALAEHARPEMRRLYAICVSLLACDGQARADREMWRTLLGLAKYDEDMGVRSAADLALTDLERHGTVAGA